MWAFSNFHENSRRYSKVKAESPVSTAAAIIEKIFLRQTVFSYVVEMLLGCCLHSYYDFLLNVPKTRCRQADIVAAASSPVSCLF
jgi:hypothetical protein